MHLNSWDWICKQPLVHSHQASANASQLPNSVSPFSTHDQPEKARSAPQTHPQDAPFQWAGLQLCPASGWFPSEHLQPSHPHPPSASQPSSGMVTSSCQSSLWRNSLCLLSPRWASSIPQQQADLVQFCYNYTGRVRTRKDVFGMGGKVRRGITPCIQREGDAWSPRLEKIIAANRSMLCRGLKVNPKAILDECLTLVKDEGARAGCSGDEPFRMIWLYVLTWLIKLKQSKAYVSGLTIFISVRKHTHTPPTLLHPVEGPVLKETCTCACETGKQTGGGTRGE